MQASERRWHREVLSPAAEEILRELRKASALADFYLAGGTGLALHLGHRRSEDFDFFSRELFDEDRMVQRVQTLPDFSLLAKSPATLHVEMGAIKVSFLGYAYPLLFPLADFDGVSLADPREIACMKISAISSRGTKRDFVDLHAASAQYGLSSLLDLFRQKFAQANYSLPHVLKSLTYFEEAESEPMPDMLLPLSWREVKSFFTEEVRRLL